ncbi:helix-turn-helix domain-containing protein [Chryseobacterium rhizosphaerae]|uniref:helix-turn-helix domain-containing protein n=1 Tax=Chryseobacterium rhizosphaerae TaxID=395937 RepID=UPI003D095AE4
MEMPFGSRSGFKSYITHNVDKSIAQIAYELGFKYLQHFIRLFKQRTGVTPNEFRNLN